MYGFDTTIPKSEGCLKFTDMVTVDTSTITDAAWVTVSNGFALPIRIFKVVSAANNLVLVRYTTTGNAQDVIAYTSVPQILNIQANHDGLTSSAGGENCKLAAKQIIQFRAPAGVTLSGKIYLVGYA